MEKLIKEIIDWRNQEFHRQDLNSIHVSTLFMPINLSCFKVSDHWRESQEYHSLWGIEPLRE